MNDFLKVKDNKDLIRHKHSSAVLNINQNELNKYREEREHKIKLNKLLDENENIKTDIDEIKSLLRQLIGQK
jgi:uncharacterized HAD superfamily protein